MPVVARPRRKVAELVTRLVDVRLFLTLRKSLSTPFFKGPYLLILGVKPFDNADTIQRFC